MIEGERVSEKQEEPKTDVTLSPKHAKSISLQQVPVDSALKKIFSIVSKQRVRVKQFMDEHDRLRKGFITQNKFEGALNAAKVFLTPAEMKSLFSAYHYADSTIDNMVLYKEFCKALEDYSVEPHIHTMTESNAALAAVSAVREMTKMLNISATPFFQDFDTLRHGKVTATQFGAVLDKLKLTANAKVSIPALVKAFSEADGQVNYTTFCAMVE